jgi:hypothetical protein
VADAYIGLAGLRLSVDEEGRVILDVSRPETTQVVALRLDVETAEDLALGLLDAVDTSRSRQ